MQRTKIIATYGPSVNDDKKLEELVLHTDIIRINFSHGTESERISAIRRIRSISERLGKDTAILADLPGPKIRISKLAEDVQIESGGRVVFCGPKGTEPGDIPIDPDIYDDMKVGSVVSIGDGSPKLRIVSLEKRRIICEALQTGVIRSGKGINVSGTAMSAEPPTAEDTKFAKFARENDLDFVAVSFVKSSENIKKMRGVVNGMGIIAKIERQEAVDDIDAIARESDAVMIARGDLVLNIDPNSMPLVQDRIIGICRSLEKPVIVATQMLESMTRNQTPTRAEMVDVANAVKSGADCVMLSDETSVGAYPIEAVTTLESIIDYTEKEMPSGFTLKKRAIDGHEGIALAAASISYTCDIHYIFVPTETGDTARMLSALRPESTIIALSDSGRMRRQLGIYYGVRGVHAPSYKTDEEMALGIRSQAKKLGADSYMLVYGHKGRFGTNDTIRCFWGTANPGGASGRKGTNGSRKEPTS